MRLTAAAQWATMREKEKRRPIRRRRKGLNMKKHGRCCKVCGEYKANEKFSGRGHAAHICKVCAQLPPEEQAERMTLNRLSDLPWQLSKAQRSWLQNRMKDKRPEVRDLAREQYEVRFGTGRRF